MVARPFDWSTEAFVHRMRPGFKTTYSAGPAGHGLCLADGAAFCGFSGIVLGAYAGVAGVTTPYLLILTDTAGKQAVGWIAEADAAEALAATDMVTNGDNEAALASFDEDGNTACTTAQSAEQAYAGSNSGKVTLDGSLYHGYRRYRDTNLSKMVAGKLYKITCWFYLPSGQTIDAYRLQLYGDANAKQLEGTETDSWTSKTAYITVNTSFSCYLLARDAGLAANSDSFYFDDLSIKEVIHAGAAGVHIVSARNGITRNWARIDSEFNYNGNYSVAVIRAADLTEKLIGHGTIGQIG